MLKNNNDYNTRVEVLVGQCGRQEYEIVERVCEGDGNGYPGLDLL